MSLPWFDITLNITMHPHVENAELDVKDRVLLIYYHNVYYRGIPWFDDDDSFRIKIEDSHFLTREDEFYWGYIPSI